MNSSNTAGPEANNNLKEQPAPYLRTKADWLELGEQRQQKLRAARAKRFQELYNNYFATPCLPDAKNAMSMALLDEITLAAKYRFASVAKRSKDPALADFVEDGADDYIQNLVIRLLRKLDAGEFESAAKLQSYLGGTVKNTMLADAYRLRAQRQKRYVPYLVIGEHDDGFVGAKENPVILAKGMQLDNRSVDFYQLTMLDALSTEDAEFLAAYELAECDIEKTADILGMAPATTRQRLHRLCVRLQTAELTEYLLDQFGADQKRVKAMTADILPLIKRMMQRATVDYPKSWEEALSLPAIPKVRRVDDDKPKSRWIQVVRSLYRLWESHFQTQREPHQKAPASPSCRLQSL